MDGEIVTVENAQPTERGLFGLDPKAIEVGRLVIDAAIDVASGKQVEVFIPVTLFGKRLSITVQAKDV